MCYYTAFFLFFFFKQKTAYEISACLVGSAQHVAIRLYDEQGNVVRLGEPAAAIPLRAGANILNFSAKYYSPLGNATAGDASAVATYTVTYS